MLFKVLEIDLSTRTAAVSSADGSPWLGGRGMATKLLFDRVDPARDPLGPDNVVAIAMSPLTGTKAPTAGRGHAAFKSPLTGGLGSSNSGGQWGRLLKAAGCDALVIGGRAAAPAYLSVAEGIEGPAVEFHDAGDLWGLSVHEASTVLKERHGRGCSVLGIGPAGENLVPFASLMNDLNRAYGRGGPGAVFGSKNLKAVAVSGSRKTEAADPERLARVIEQTRHNMRQAPITKRVMRELGTAGLMNLINIMGMLPHRNFQDAEHDEAKVWRLAGETISEEILERAGGCFGCPVMCQRHTRAGGRSGEGPEYETAALLGALLDVYDLEAVTVANYEANELGLDTMSLGGALACAAELFERGALSRDEFREAVVFGEPGVYPEVVGKIARREGVGSMLALGARAMAEKAESPDAAMHVKGLELPAYDPRGMPAQALGYMTSPTGACHLRGGYAVALAYFGGYKEVPRFSVRQASVTAMNQHNLGIIQDSMGICRFTGYAVGADHWARTYSAVTGEDTSTRDLERAAERIAALERLFNLRAGLGRENDNLPARFKTEPIVIDGRERVVSESDRERMLDDYYRDRGWDRDGVPLDETLDELGLDF